LLWKIEAIQFNHFFGLQETLFISFSQKIWIGQTTHKGEKKRAKVLSIVRTHCWFKVLEVHSHLMLGTLVLSPLTNMLVI
jgi:hypothetical protein